MLSITNDQENANKDHNEILHCNHQYGYYFKNTKGKMLRECEESGTVSHYWYKYKIV